MIKSVSTGQGESRIIRPTQSAIDNGDMAGIMEGNATKTKWTEAKFFPEVRKGLHKPNSIEWMVMVTGVAICSMGGLAVPIGAAIALGTAYSGFFVQPKAKRGIFMGKCPHCGAVMSATHYQEELGCPSCDGLVKVKNGHYEAA